MKWKGSVSDLFTLLLPELPGKAGKAVSALGF
jgi:hypothetical protein